MSLRHELGVLRDGTIVLFAAKLIRLKRASDLIDAFSRICGRVPDSHLVIVGSGEEEDNLRRQVAGVADGRVHFLGFLNQTDLPSIYAACDLFVLPSDNESWGLVVNEAMAAGLPVIVSDDVGAAPDLVANTGAGMVYPCGDIDALAACLETMLGDGGLRTRVAARSREVIASWDVTCTADAITSAAQKVAPGKLTCQEGLR